MPYAVVGYFDKQSALRIKALWKGMADTNVCDYLSRSDNDPHIKFAMNHTMDLVKAEKAILSVTNELSKIDIQFKTYSFYPNEKPFVCIDIAVSKPILDLHSKIQTECDKYGEEDGRGFFEEGIWKPDCQLTVEFDKVRLASAIDYLSETKLPFEGTLAQIGVIKFHPAEQLFSYELK